VTFSPAATQAPGSYTGTYSVTTAGGASNTATITFLVDAAAVAPT
jgi:hypothetical protein